MKKLRYHHLKPTPGSTKQKLRKGRGEAGKRGKTAGRGTKGTGARKTVPAYFEGGQIPLYRRIPKFGFKSPNRIETKPINLDVLQNLVDKLKLKEIDPDTLTKNGLAKKNSLIKILGRGKIKSKFNIKSHMFSKSAIKAIEKAGGKIQIISND